MLWFNIVNCVVSCAMFAAPAVAWVIITCFEDKLEVLNMVDTVSVCLLLQIASSTLAMIYSVCAREEEELGVNELAKQLAAGSMITALMVNLTMSILLFRSCSADEEGTYLKPLSILTMLAVAGNIYLLSLPSWTRQRNWTVQVLNFMRVVFGSVFVIVCMVSGLLALDIIHNTVLVSVFKPTPLTVPFSVGTLIFTVSWMITVACEVFWPEIFTQLFKTTPSILIAMSVPLCVAQVCVAGKVCKVRRLHHLILLI